MRPEADISGTMVLMRPFHSGMLAWIGQAVMTDDRLCTKEFDSPLGTLFRAIAMGSTGGLRIMGDRRILIYTWNPPSISWLMYSYGDILHKIAMSPLRSKFRHKSSFRESETDQGWINVNKEAIREILIKCVPQPHNELSCSYAIINRERSAGGNVFGVARDEEDENDLRLYCIDALTETLIAYCIWCIIEKITKENPEKMLEDRGRFDRSSPFADLHFLGWSIPVEQAFNGLRKEKGLEQVELETTPTTTKVATSTTLEDLLRHWSALPDVDQELLTQIRTSAAPEDEFIKIITGSLERTPGRPKEFRHSRANYVLAALILEMATKMEFEKLLQRTVLGPAKMKNVVLTGEELNKRREVGSIAEPFVATIEGTKPVNPPNHLDNTVGIASGGVYCSAEDIAKLLKRISDYKEFGSEGFQMKQQHRDESREGEGSRQSSGRPGESRQQEQEEKWRGEKERSLLEGPTHDAGAETYGATLLGKHAPLSSAALVSLSPEREISMQTRHLGEPQPPLEEGQEIWAYSKAGTGHGYSSHYFYVHSCHLIVVVLTNVSGAADPSFHIARYLLQQILQPKKTVDFAEQAANARKAWERRSQPGT